MFSYRAYGLAIHSELPLPGASPLAEDKADASIRFADIDWSPDEAAPGDDGFHFAADEAYLYWRGLGKFLVRGGREIVIEASAEASRELLRLPLLGVVMAVLLHQRGQLVLHASAVAIEEKAVAFVAPKGQGKSTLAAMLCARGHQLLADDLVLLNFASPQAPAIVPGLAQIKLWPEAATTIGEDPEALPRLSPGQEKRLLAVNQRFSAAPLTLHSIYTLGVGEAVELEPLNSRDAMLQLITHTYVARFGKQLLRDHRAQLHLHQCAEVIRSRPLYRLNRPASLTTLAASADLVEAQVKGLASAPEILTS
jgi:hypothetical protein